MTRLEKLLLAGILVLVLLFGKTVMLDTQYHGFIGEPVQVNLASPKTITISGIEGPVNATLLAEYTVDGVVKGKQRYSDYPSQISAYDFIMAWGDLPTKEVGNSVKYSQSVRWYYFRYFGDTPVTVDYISNHSANVHLIHQNAVVLAQIKKVDKGDRVTLHGYLVNVAFENGPWKSSLTRGDTGNGACEVMYVTAVTNSKGNPL